VNVWYVYDKITTVHHDFTKAIKCSFLKKENVNKRLKDIV